MKRNISNIIMILCFISGILLLLYPSVSNFYNSFHQSKVIASYLKKVNNIDNEEHDQLLSYAIDYNKYLYELTKNNTLKYGTNISYNNEDLQILKGNMGYIEIPKIDVNLPIYSGTGKEVLQIAIGLLDGSSIPTGEESTHAVLVGHRGLPNSKLFTNIDKLKIGDIFYINILAEKVAYEVDQIKVVKPEDVDDIKIVEGKAYATLVTCTPYGINTHRLLVRGHKIDLKEASYLEYNLNDKVYFDIEKIVIIACITSSIIMIYSIRKLKILS